MQKMPLILSVLLAVIAWNTVRTHSHPPTAAPVTASHRVLQQQLNSYLAGRLFAITDDSLLAAPSDDDRQLDMPQAAGAGSPDMPAT